jgi:hypothetical protein
MAAEKLPAAKNRDCHDAEGYGAKHKAADHRWIRLFAHNRSPSKISMEGVSASGHGCDWCAWSCSPISRAFAALV